MKFYITGGNIKQEVSFIGFMKVKWIKLKWDIIYKIRFYREKLFIYRHLTIPVYLWELRGLKECEKHGFHAQSWINGKCSECDL